MNHAAPTEQFDRVMEDVAESRREQIAKGYTPDHDDRWYPYISNMLTLGTQRLRRQGGPSHDNGLLDRQNMIDGIAILVAAVEKLDRNADGKVGTYESWLEAQDG